MATIFSQIIQRTVPAHIVADSKHYMAFLDVRPLARGHTLVVPKQEIDYLFDLDDEILGGIFIFAKQVALGIQKVVSCLRMGVAVVGLEVPHAHVHLVPLCSAYDIDFKKPTLKFSQEEQAFLANQIRAAIKPKA